MYIMSLSPDFKLGQTRMIQRKFVYMIILTVIFRIIIMAFDSIVEPMLHASCADVSAQRTTRASAGLGDPVAEGAGGQHHDSYGRTGLSVGENKD